MIKAFDKALISRKRFLPAAILITLMLIGIISNPDAQITRFLRGIIIARMTDLLGELGRGLFDLRGATQIRRSL